MTEITADQAAPEQRPDQRQTARPHAHGRTQADPAAAQPCADAPEADCRLQEPLVGSNSGAGPSVARAPEPPGSPRAAGGGRKPDRRKRDRRVDRQTLIRGKDGRSREMMLLRATRAGLIEQLGGEGRVTAAQRMLVEDAAMLTLHMALIDARAVSAGGMSQADQKSYTSMRNTRRRALVLLGLENAPRPRPTVSDFVASIPRTRAPAAK